MSELHVDWQALDDAYRLNVPEIRCYFCLTDGATLRVLPGEPPPPTGPGQYVAIRPICGRVQYQWIEAFVRSIDDRRLQQRFRVAINGKGAFRRFKDLLLKQPSERQRWFKLRDAWLREWMVGWVLRRGVVPLNPPVWDEAKAAAPARQQAETTPSIPATHIGPLPTPRAVEALKHLLIEWIDGDDHGQPPTANELEELALHIVTQFVVQPLAVHRRQQEH